MEKTLVTSYLNQHRPYPFIRSEKRIKSPGKQGGFNNRKTYLRSIIAFPVECFWCGNALSLDTHTFDHVITKSEGGTLQQGNLLHSCKPCNEERRNTPFIVFMLIKFNR